MLMHAFNAIIVLFEKQCFINKNGKKYNKFDNKM